MDTYDMNVYEHRGTWHFRVWKIDPEHDREECIVFSEQSRAEGFYSEKRATVEAEKALKRFQP